MNSAARSAIFATLALLACLSLAAVAEEPPVADGTTTAESPAPAKETPADPGPSIPPPDAAPFAAHPHARLLRRADPLVAAALDGYNREDHALYVSGFAKSMARTASEAVFRGHVIGAWKAEAGEFRARGLIDRLSLFEGEAPVLVYNAEFERGGRLLTVEFKREGDLLRVARIRVEPLPEEGLPD